MYIILIKQMTQEGFNIDTIIKLVLRAKITGCNNIALSCLACRSALAYSMADIGTPEQSCFLP